MLVEIAVVGLVSYRLWRLLAVDGITQPARAWLIDHTTLRETGWWFDFLYCPWCLGAWLTVAVGLTSYFAGLTSETPWLVIPAAAVVCGWLGEHI